MIPFTRADFLGIFASYNDAIWPAQLVAYLLAAGAVGLIVTRPASAGKAVVAVLAAMWLWTGVGYHYLFFRAINPAAVGFAAAFVLQGLLLAYYGVVRGEVGFSSPSGIRRGVGIAFIAYASVLYPIVGWAMGERYPAVPIFGLTPCPLVIFTCAIMMMSVPPAPRALLGVPVLWSLIGGSAAVLLTMPQDLMLPIAALVAVLDAYRRRPRSRYGVVP